MTKTDRRRPRRQQESDDDSQRQSTMDGRLITTRSTAHQNTGLKYLVQSFTLCSVDREVNKKGKGKRPDPRYRRSNPEPVQAEIEAVTGRKVRDVDLSLLGRYFEKYVELVNLVLERVYAHRERLDFLGEELNSYRGQGYNLLQKEEYLAYKDNPEIAEQCFERLYRNVLENAARIIQSNWLRRSLMESAIALLREDSDSLLRLLKNKYVPSQLIKDLREQRKSRDNGSSGYYFSLSVLKQLRKTFDEHILKERGEGLGYRPTQRRRVRHYLKDDAETSEVMASVDNLMHEFATQGYPFPAPTMFSYSEDFSASSENVPGQGYWYSQDLDREDEVLFFVKIPEPMEGERHKDSPFRTRTLSFRFLDWLPQAAAEDRRKADEAEQAGKHIRAKKLRFRAMRFEDQHAQLVNTIELQHATYQLVKWKNRKGADPEKVAELKERVQRLRESRTCGPPLLLLRNHRVMLQVPFAPPTAEMIDDVLGERQYNRSAGADRGIRVPIVLSVRNGDDEYADELISLDKLVRKRDHLRHQTSHLSSKIALMRNNWEKKHGEDYPKPGHLRKKKRHLSAIWRKVRRLDREIARQVASKAVWFCENHSVKTLYLENLKNYKPPGGYGTHSWRLSSNLWCKVLDTIRYMRQTLGHRRGGIWTVSPAWTSRKCHVCSEKGIRVETPDSSIECRGGEFFYCPHCSERIHADVNAARNILNGHREEPSAVAGRTIQSTIQSAARGGNR